jgi:hypothetical protein
MAHHDDIQIKFMMLGLEGLARLGIYPGIYLPTWNTWVDSQKEKVGIYSGIYPDTLGIYLPMPNTVVDLPIFTAPFRPFRARVSSLIKLQESSNYIQSDDSTMPIALPRWGSALHRVVARRSGPSRVHRYYSSYVFQGRSCPQIQTPNAPSVPPSQHPLSPSLTPF